MEDEISTKHGGAGYRGTPPYRLLLRHRRPAEVFLRERMPPVRTQPEMDDGAPGGPGTGPVERETER